VETTPILIKRYENRKLYDTSRSVYVTLEDLAGMIREGKEIKVVDAKTNEDLTKNTLALIILEQERDKKNLLPLSFMYQLIKYGEQVQGTFQDYLSTGFDAFLASQREVQKRVQEWAGTGAAPKSRPTSEPPDTSNETLRMELEELKRKVAELESRHKPRKK
jgi:polyhydroxyalkanoate synthesis repressor PhaR